MTWVAKKPFRDKHGQWWIYRSDDDDMTCPLGPFLTKEYAKEVEQRARDTYLPLPAKLSHPYPVMR